MNTNPVNYASKIQFLSVDVNSKKRDKDLKQITLKAKVGAEEKTYIITYRDQIEDEELKKNILNSEHLFHKKITQFISQQPSIEKGQPQVLELPRLPKKAYTTLSLLEDNQIPFTYTPFDQGALVDVLNDKWLGACNEISHNWLHRKMTSSDLNQPVFYSITESHLPYPIIYNQKTNEVIEAELHKIGNEEEIGKREVEYKTEKKDVDAFCEYLRSKNEVYGFFNALVILLNASYHDLSQIGHAVAFAKRGEQISWFDPNHGEITFNSIKDFQFWFENETSMGNLRVLMNKPENQKLKFSDYFPQPEFTEKEKQSFPLAEKIIERRNREAELRKAITNCVVCDYNLVTYSKDNEKKSENWY